MPGPKAADFTAEELAGAQLVRAQLGNDPLPELFDTDYYLARWWRAYNGDLAKIDKYLRQYLINRALLSYDVEDMHHALTTFPNPSRVLRYFSVSRLDQKVRSGDCSVFVQRMKGVNLKEVVLFLTVQIERRNHVKSRRQLCEKSIIANAELSV